MIQNQKIGIIGLGYVGLPLAIAFGKKYEVVGFDINPKRISELKNHIDRTNEINADDFKEATRLSFSSKKDDLKDCNVYIVTVPTPVDKYNNPDFEPLIGASRTVGQVLSKNNIVVYESTVYPGATEEQCVPILESISGLSFNKDFFCGYSPERINPGDKEHTVSAILKVTSGSTPETAAFVNELYGSVISAGTFKATSIRVAEAAKVIENAQRDINIAFVNELAKIFNLIGLDTNEVLEAAGTKWNFLKFKPGLVGGHCIGVDPYYLAQKAKEVGYHPEILLAGRRLNDSMGEYVADETVKLMVKKQVNLLTSEVLVLGFTFKENCPDVRNTKVVDIIHNLHNYNLAVTVMDPWASKEEVEKEYGLQLINTLEEAKAKRFDAIVLAVAHSEFLNLDLTLLKKAKNSVIYDVKGVLPRTLTDKRL